MIKKAQLELELEQIVVLRMAGKSGPEIAKKLGISEGSVWRRCKILRDDGMLPMRFSPERAIRQSDISERRQAELEEAENRRVGLIRFDGPIGLELRPDMVGRYLKVRANYIERGGNPQQKNGVQNDLQ